MQPRAFREREQIEPARGDVLADFARPHVKSCRAQFIVQFGVDQMNLTEIGLCRVFSDAHQVLHRLTQMRIALYA
jgi:hypothetical protein